MARRVFVGRKNRAAALAETPLAIWVTIFGLFFPLFALATCLLRYSFLMTAAHEAAYDAAISKTFSTDVSATDPCAVNAAVAKANSVAANFNGITIQSVSTRIIQNDSQTNNMQVYSVKLQNPADTSRYVYLLETTVVGSIMPIVSGQSGMFGTVPGLTAPMVVQATSRKVAENPQGLNL